MKVDSSDQLGNAKGISLQAQSPLVDTKGGRPDGPKYVPSDTITVSDFTRIALMVPPQDKGRLDDLQLAVTSGEYGPPAATIAEALISRAIFCGLSP